jgi:NADP-dependent 3-hydroxy acid dehydrogenase YdfG
MPKATSKGAAVVTGASSGIGEASAHAFARLGYPLVLGARRIERLTAVASRCKELGAPRVLPLPLDVRDEKSAAAFCDAVLRDEPGFEILLNNAGLAAGKDPVQTLHDEDLRAMVETNVLGLVRITRHLVPSMVERKQGHVIMLGSLAAHGVYEGGAVYCGSKTFVRVFTQALRLDVAGANVRVSEIDPGMVETEFSVVRLGDADKAKAVYAGVQPLVAADIADVIAWVATRPPHVNIGEVVMTPVAQASLTKVSRG